MLLTATLLAVLPQAPIAFDENHDTLQLFDGKTLDGWAGDPRYWSVEDGEIVGRSTTSVPLAATTYLVHEGGPFADFDLSLEYRIDGGNSGIQFRSRRGDGYQVTGYQADMDAAGDWTGGFYEQGGRGVVNRRSVRMLKSGPNTAYELLGDPKELSKLGGPGAWHTYRVRAEGTRLSLFVDGVLTSEFDDREPQAASSGILALQLHQGPPMEVRFRNISLQPIERSTPPSTPAGAALWIWNDPEPSSTEVVRFERAVRARGEVKAARLWASGDDGVEFSFDDQVFAGGEKWSEPFQVEFPPRFLKLLGDGKPHRLSAECWNGGGPAGLIARLEIEYEDGSTDRVETDRWWKVRDAPAHEIGPIGTEPWGVPTGTSSGAPDLPLAASRLELPPGFEATEVLRVPRTYGSWVAITVDDRGRLVCAAENGPGLYRVTLGDDGRAANVEQLDLDVPGAQGLLAVGRDLYVVQNVWPTGSSGLYRARDTNGDDSYDEFVLLTALDGGGEHGPHAVRLAPDGEHLEVIAGNSTRMPADVERYHMLPLWHGDQLLPSLPDTFGHGNTMHDHGGWIGRCDLDGEHWEVLCTGMRNSYDFAYDRTGERFTYDADMEWDMGAPWYRAPRVLHLAPGAEFGWRRGSGKIDDAEPDNFGSVCATGPASPVGVLHGKGGAFHGEFGESLFVGDWTRGIIYSVALTSDRDTFTGEAKPFLLGRPFPVTDMEWLPDGSMIVMTGGRGRRSAVYRVKSTIGRIAPDPSTAIAPIGVESGPRSALERRVALELYPDVDAWLERALAEFGVAGELALARAGGPARQPRLLKHLLGVTRGPLSRDTLRVMELSMARNGMPPAALAESLRGRLEWQLGIALAEDGSIAAVVSHDVKLAELLVFLGSDQVPRIAVPLMEQAASQERVLDFAMALRLAPAGWTDELARRALDVLHADTRAFVGGRSIEGYIERIRAAMLESVQPFLDGPYSPPALDAGAAVPTRALESPMFVREWTLSDLVGSLGAVATATDRAAGRLAFERAGCFACHRVGNEGGGTGPDLTDAGGRFTPRDLLITILEPSRDISDQYRDTEVWTHDGEVFVGRRVESSDEWTTLQLPAATHGATDGDVVDIAAEDIKLARPHPTSSMPKGTLDGLQSQAIVEMLAWLLAEK